ncbi:hypothetical protein MASR1M60_02910 [Rhodocyclaceae bacterium]
MEAAQTVAAYAQAGDFRPIDFELHAGGDEATTEAGRKFAGAETIDQHPYRYAPIGGADECGDNALPGFVIREEVGFEMNLACGAGDGGFERGKEIAARFEQVDLVAGQKVGAHETAVGAKEKRADSAAWSEMDDHGGP